MKSILSFFSFLIIICIPYLSWSQYENERIIQFDIEIQMNEDRSIDVYEKIEVYAAGNQIKRGITRGLPTRRFIENQKYIVKYKDLSIRRNGQEEPFHSVDVENGELLRIGQRDYYLPKGNYVYEIRYSVPNQIDWLDDFDRLRWNAIGTDVVFETEKASIKILLPKNAKLQNAKTYIGSFGSSGNQARVLRVADSQSIQFNIEEGLRPGEGITTSLNLEKGSILKPTLLERSGGLLTILLSSLFLLGYFLYTWLRYGRDPEPSTGGLLYATPQDLSPASINYIQAGSYKPRSMTSSIISLGVKGFIHVTRDVGGSARSKNEKYIITKLKSASDSLPPEEGAIMKHLFNHKDSFVLDGSYDEKISKMNIAHMQALKAQHRDFVKAGSNLKFIWIPILVFILTIALSLVLSFVFGLGSLAIWKQLLIFIPIALIGLGVYRYLIIQPTQEKVNLLNDIEGFKKYIQMSGNERTKLDNAPGINVDHFESILPYAFALGVEKNWSSLFEDYLQSASYKPNWTDGDYMYGSHFHNHFYRQVQSSSYKPAPSGGGGFSSGSSGGGFSGGGGGGGSVGGW